MLRRRGQFEAAAESFRQALHHSPGDVQAMQELYGYHRFRDQPAEAERYARQLRALGEEPMSSGPGGVQQLPPGVQLGRQPRKMPPGFKLPACAPPAGVFGVGCAGQLTVPGRPEPTRLRIRGEPEMAQAGDTDAGPTTRETSGPAPGTCRATGCSNHICADDDVMSTCELKPHYRCFRYAKCERQADGRCTTDRRGKPPDRPEGSLEEGHPNET